MQKWTGHKGSSGQLRREPSRQKRSSAKPARPRLPAMTSRFSWSIASPTRWVAALTPPYPAHTVTMYHDVEPSIPHALVIVCQMSPDPLRDSSNCCLPPMLLMSSIMSPTLSCQHCSRSSVCSWRRSRHKAWRPLRLPRSAFKPWSSAWPATPRPPLPSPALGGTPLQWLPQVRLPFHTSCGVHSTQCNSYA